jgi:hypothetical protein
MAASWHSSSKNLDLAGRPLWRKLPDRFGSKAHSDDWPLPGIGIPLAAFREGFEERTVAPDPEQTVGAFLRNVGLAADSGHL